ncbi:hypothetical protein B0H67DRAFT_660089 [Lasiosphaeris hirsuta]|uniref:Uncharacterized protein n=1 Tax=Lasiosphaeris hirsuta TaxID=260670 RepID=A0AA40B1M6_9PEZI|nr:hypothetical protein B0H67DRAFT_660089 [Lasiosphaeris hirsuta]
MLKHVYAPFAGLKKGSPEYEELAASGRMFEPILKKIDYLKHSMGLPARSIVESLVAEYAYQSVRIEDNMLHLGDSMIINDHLVSMSARELSKAALPNLQSMLPIVDPSQLAELRNHIIACHWVAKKAMQSLSTLGLDENEVKSLSSLIVRDINSEAMYSAGWGKRVKLGDYRQTPIVTKSNPLRIFPYHVEVPALMKRFFEVSRLLFQDALIRQGYIPVSLRGVVRDDYLRMIRDAQDGDPSDFVAKILSTQLEAMHTFRARKSEEGYMEA